MSQPERKQERKHLVLCDWKNPSKEAEEKFIAAPLKNQLEAYLCIYVINARH